MSKSKAASLHEVTVLMPHGHRVVVRVPPQTPLVKVLDIACSNTWKKVDASSLALRRPGQHNELDLTVSLQYSALPNCAQLEAVPAAKGKRIEKPCSVALQIPGMSRLVADFLLDTKVWDVLRHWDHSDTSLRLTNRYESPSPGSSQRSGDSRDGDNSSEGHSQDSSGNKEPRRELMTLQLPCCRYMRSELSTLQALRDTSLRDFGIAGSRALINVRFVHSQLTPADVDDKLDTVSNPQVNSVSGTRTSDKEAPIPSASVGPTTNACMTTVSQQASPPTDANLTAPQGLSPGEAVSLLVVQPAEQRAPPPTATVATSQSVSAAAALGGMLAVPVPDESSNDKETMQIPARNYVVYTRPQTQVVTPADVSDDFYNLTSMELSRMLKECRTTYSPSEQPLLTRALRQKLADEKEAKYKHARIRVYFPDDYILEASMHPKETIHALMQCVRECLENPSAKFYLYTTPPKRTLPDMDDTATLSSMGLVPNANVRLGFHGGEGGSCKLRNSLTVGAEKKKLLTPTHVASEPPTQSQPAVAGKAKMKPTGAPKGGLQFLKGLSKR
eukprot:m.133123 g.133123  ORF g.133123 m.133123 type:complete len:559 (-) comp17527_c0_seq1:161-1837(-)